MVDNHPYCAEIHHCDRPASICQHQNLVMETRSTAKIKTAIQMGYLYVALLFGFLLLLEGGFGDWVRTIFELNIFYWGMVAVAVITVYSGLEYLVMNRAMFKKNPSA